MLVEPESPWSSQGRETVGQEGVQDEGDREQIVITGSLRDVAIGPIDSLLLEAITATAAVRGVASRLTFLYSLRAVLGRGQ